MENVRRAERNAKPGGGGGQTESREKKKREWEKNVGGKNWSPVEKEGDAGKKGKCQNENVTQKNWEVKEKMREKPAKLEFPMCRRQENGGG